MDFLHIRNLDKYQPGYKDRTLTWGKIWTKMGSGDPDCDMILNEIDWSRLIRFILLEISAQKPIPLDEKFLTRKGFDFEQRSLKDTILALHHFVEIRTENVTEMSPRVEKIRVEESREDKSATRFKQPSKEDLFDYFTAQGGLEAATAEAEALKFLDYYSSVGWVVGRSRKPMKNWRGSAATWLRNRREWVEESANRPSTMNKKQIANLEALDEFSRGKGFSGQEGVRARNGTVGGGVPRAITST